MFIGYLNSLRKSTYRTPHDHRNLRRSGCGPM
jgi:hypothetical protein